MALRNCALRLATFAAPWLLLCQTAAVESPSNDRTMTQVVKLLQNMLDQSKADGDSERDLFAKYKCYCDTNEASKKAEIERLTSLIGLLENKIEQLLARATELSKKLQETKRKIVATEEARDKATALRQEQYDEFQANSGDLDEAINDTRDAIAVLAEVNADQTGGENWEDHTSQDHSQFMANYTSLSALRTTLRTALVSATSLAGQRQLSTIESFLQDPFTGTYAAHSGEVVGILKDMHDTFKANLQEATATEERAVKAYQKFMDITGKELSELNETEFEAESDLDSNQGELASKREQLELAQEDLGDAQTFLSSLLSMRDAKTKQYNERVALRRKEETAVAEAISILNSDAAFATFGTVSATKTGATSFAQLRAINRHDVPAMDGSRKKVTAFLQRTAANQHSPMLGHIVALLRTKNPFAVVLAEIDKMIELIAAEERADDEQQQWCDQERAETDQSISTKTDELSALARAIGVLKAEINDPQDGLLAQLTATETSMQENHDSQVSQTEQRRKENAAYQEDVQNLVSAEALLKRAIVVLRNYYSKIRADISPALMQKASPTEPEPPSTWDDKYTGQSDGASSVLDMMDFILRNTQTEETEAHNTEVSAQHDYESSMQGLKDDMETLQGILSHLQATLAEKRQELKSKEKDHAVTSKEKTALENYLEKIKPGCDYITTNLDGRKAHRAEETGALEEAKRLLKASPAHAEAEAQAHQESLGACAGKCNTQGEDHVDCKACLAKVSVPGYCAGHPRTEGCTTP